MYEPSPQTPGPGGNLEPTLRCNISTDEADGVVVSLHGELDLAAAPELLRQLQAMLAEPVTSVTLDLDALEFIDSSGLGVLCQVQQVTQDRGIRLELVRVPRHARRVLEVTGLTETFNLT